MIRNLINKFKKFYNKSKLELKKPEIIKQYIVVGKFKIDKKYTKEKILDYVTKNEDWHGIEKTKTYITAYTYSVGYSHASVVGNLINGRLKRISNSVESLITGEL
jgi:hypothetical protein